MPPPGESDSRENNDKQSAGSLNSNAEDDPTVGDLEKMAMILDQESLVVVDYQGFVSSFLFPTNGTARSCFDQKQSFLDMLKRLDAQIATPRRTEALGRSKVLS